MFKMSNTRHQNFRSFLTEKFTSVAVEIFGEVESIVEAYYEENKRLRNILHMVLDPEIKLPRIDISQYTGTTTDVREESPELSTTMDLEISELLPEKLKEEQIECDISCGSEQQHGLEGADNLITPDLVKNEDSDVPSISGSFHTKVVDFSSDYSTTVSADEAMDEDEDWFSRDSDAVTDLPQFSWSKDSTSENCDRNNHDRNLSKKRKSKQALQKTMLELPRTMTFDSVMDAPPDCQSFLARITEAFTEDVELVDSAFGKVPKGCPLSYQCPAPSNQDYKTHDNAPSRPLLPLSQHTLEPMVNLPTLSVKELQHLDIMYITWEAAHSLEHSTRPPHEHKELVEPLQKLRLTGRFKEICKLKPGRSHAEHLIFKIQKGFRSCEVAEGMKEMKAKALRDYCQQLCLNWSPCGFVVHPTAPWLGALPDGLVYDPNEKSCFGLVHVKCVTLRSFINCRFLSRQDGVLQLRKSHSYYWHIQGEMMVSGTSWCDLLVFSREDLLVQRIYRDTDMISVMKKKLDEFFFYYYLPSLF